MLLTFQYRLNNPRNIQKILLGFFIIITATTEDICPPNEKQLNHVIVQNPARTSQTMNDKQIHR